MIRILWGTPPPPPARTGMAAWSARVHGPGWDETRRRYWHDPPPWRRTRCYWCRRANPGEGRRWASRRRLQLNHLTYAYSDDTGRCPLPVLRPMCGFCHTVETWLTRRVRPGMARHRQRWAHAYVTVAVRQVVNLLVLAPVLLLAFTLAGCGPATPPTGDTGGTSGPAPQRPPGHVACLTAQADRCGGRAPLELDA